MKRYLTILFFLAGAAQCLAQEARDFTINGKISGVSTGYMKILYNNGNSTMQDSAKIVDGLFEIKGVLREPAMAYFFGPGAKMNAQDPNFGMAFIEPRNMKFEATAGEFRKLNLIGSTTEDESKALAFKKRYEQEKYDKAAKDYTSAEAVYLEAKKTGLEKKKLETLKAKSENIKEQMGQIVTEMNKIDHDYVIDHPDSYYSAYWLQGIISSMPIEEGRKMFENLSPKIQQSVFGKQVVMSLKKLERGSPGSFAANFSSKDMNGANLSLSDYKGNKYVLLDFWASWCVPCRKGNPHLIQLYKKYKDKGFEIIGISDDDNDLKAWKSAVKNDKIGIWKHILRGYKRKSDTTSTNLDISNLYGISSLPTKILVDKDGLIIGRYNGSEEDDLALDKLLSEIFN